MWRMKLQLLLLSVFALCLTPAHASDQLDKVLARAYGCGKVLPAPFRVIDRLPTYVYTSAISTSNDDYKRAIFIPRVYRTRYLPQAPIPSPLLPVRSKRAQLILSLLHD